LTGTLKTAATWTREFVHNHPAYKHDSVVNAEINYDLVKTIDEIERGVRKAEDLLGKKYRTTDQLDLGDNVTVANAPEASAVLPNGVQQ